MSTYQQSKRNASKELTNNYPKCILYVTQEPSPGGQQAFAFNLCRAANEYK